MRFRALLTFAALLFATTAAAQPTPPFHVVRGESSAAIWLGTIENNFPNYPTQRESLRSWHKLNFPWAYAFEDSIPTPEGKLLEFDVFVTGAPGGTVRGGIPIPDEKNLEATVAEARVGAIVGAARVEAVYPDGTARWVTVALPPATPSGWVRLELYSGSAPLLNPTKVSSNSSGVRSDVWTETYGWGGTSIWRAWTNTTPTGTIQGGTQPSCRGYGQPEERTANAAGATIRLRAGEQVGTAAVAPRALWCASSWYRDAEDEAFFGPVAVLGQPGDRGAFMDLCLAELTKRVRTEGLRVTYADGSRTAIEPLRDHGDVSADHEGDLYIDAPANQKELLTKFRNNEYGIVDCLWRCFAALVGEPGSTPDPRAADVFEATVLSARHWSTVDVYHVEAGPLRWMWGCPWQHAGHGESGTNDPHRGAGPGTGHYNSDGVPIVRYLVADPIMDEACDLVERCLRWKVENGPGMPGIPNHTGEERATANVLRILMEGRLDQPADSTAYLAAISRVLEEGVAARSYVSGDGSGKVKPIFVVLLLEELERYEKQGSVRAGELLVTIRNYMAANWIIDPNGTARLYYQRNPDITAWVGSQGLLAADNLRNSHPQLAARLYQTGSVDPWYGSDRIEWPKVLTAQAILDWGHRFAGAR